MNRIIYVALLLMLPALGFSANKALLIGVGKYRNGCAPGTANTAEHPCVPNLSGIDLDVKRMHEAALAMGIAETQIHTLENERATLSAIEKELQGWFREGVEPQDHLLLYFSSHGSTVKGRDGDVGVIIPHDVAFLPQSLSPVLTGPVLSNFLAANPSRNILLIVDACHSGRLTSAKSLGSDVVPKVLTYPGMPDEDLSADLFHAGVPASKGVEEINIGYLSACTQKETAGATPNGSLLTLALDDSWKKLRQSRQGASLANALPLITQYMTAGGHNDQHPETEGQPRLLKADWFSSRQSGGPPPPSAEPPRTVSRTKAWDFLEDIAKASSGSISARISQREYQKGDLMDVSVDSPQDGYIFVLSVGEGDEKPTQLFPNKWQSDNHFPAGPVAIPKSGANWHIRQGLPSGVSRQQVLVVVVLSHSADSLKDLLSGTGPFKDVDVPEVATRSPFAEEAASPGGYLATRITCVIKDKQ